MKNGVFYGNFNPLHNSHIDLIKKGLEHFDVLHIFIRNLETDIVDHDTKAGWLEILNEEVGGRLRVYPLGFPEGSIRPDGSMDLVAVFSETERAAGVRIDGMISGGDKAVWLETLKPAFPDREFIVIPRSDIRSHAIRDNLDELKADIPDYVYDTLSRLL